MEPDTRRRLLDTGRDPHPRLEVGTAGRTPGWLRLRRRTRQRIRRGALYAAFAVGVVVLAVVADWPKIARAFFNPEIAAGMFPEVVTIAARNTLIFTFAAFAFGLVVGLVLALMRLSTVGPYRWFATVYIEIFRGLPALLTVLVVGFFLPIAFQGFELPFGVFGQGAVALGIVAAAYMAETIRAGIQAVPKGQMEAARSLGMSQSRAMASIVIPQAARIIIPPMTNELVLLIKDTSLLFLLGFTLREKELLAFGRDIAQSTFNATPLTVIGLVYLAITIPMTRLVAVLETRAGRSR